MFLCIHQVFLIWDQGKHHSRRLGSNSFDFGFSPPLSGSKQHPRMFTIDLHTFQDQKPRARVLFPKGLTRPNFSLHRQGSLELQSGARLLHHNHWRKNPMAHKPADTVVRDEAFQGLSLIWKAASCSEHVSRNSKRAQATSQSAGHEATLSTWKPALVAFSFGNWSVICSDKRCRFPTRFFNEVRCWAMFSLTWRNKRAFSSSGSMRPCR